MKCGYCREFEGTVDSVLSHQRAGCSTDPRWKLVVRLRENGKADKAARVAKRILGVKKKGPPMSEETKEYLHRRKAERKAIGR